VLLDYLMHLSPTVFLVAALGVTGLLRLYWRTTRLRTEVALFIPVLIILAYHFTVGVGYREPGDPVAGTAALPCRSCAELARYFGLTLVSPNAAGNGETTPINR